MTMIFRFVVLAVLLVSVEPCFALWGIVPVTREAAKELGMEVRWTPAGPDQVLVELEFKVEGVLKKFSQVNLRFGQGSVPSLTAPLKEDRSKPGRVVVHYNASRAHLEQTHLSVMVPELLGGTVYEIQVKDFVDLRKAR